MGSCYSIKFDFDTSDCPGFVQIGTMSRSGIRIVGETSKPGGTEDENGTKVQIECGTKIQINSVTRIGTWSNTEIRFESGIGNGVYLYQDWLRNEKLDHHRSRE
ncbi:hypothetical protein EVAR_36255_1 [Eumeta japonica]|uniref:Uncharacterized protein n=1 Tax=Eumeta variegata TaxID=151549 RepID=A0A4C1WXY4_EUMVA|nr:hypothetical protein EVAR_36255_1 [Eumeta japonica]